MTDSGGESATGAATDTASDAAESTDDEAYSGIFGAVPYAFGASESRLFRSYVVIGGLLTALIALFFVFGVVVLIGNTASQQGGTLTFSRSFFVVLMVLTVAPLVAPVLSVARRHRRGGSTRAYDRALAAGGYLFVCSLYVGLVVSAPAELRDDPSGPLGPAVDALYSLPRLAGFGPPVLATVLIYLLHRHFR